MLGAESDVGIGREVKHDVAAGHGTRERGEVERVALDEREARMRDGAGEKPRWPVEKLSKATTLWPSDEKAIDEGAADEPGAAGDECTH